MGSLTRWNRKKTYAPRDEVASNQLALGGHNSHQARSDGRVEPERLVEDREHVRQPADGVDVDLVGAGEGRADLAG